MDEPAPAPRRPKPAYACEVCDISMETPFVTEPNEVFLCKACALRLFFCLSQ
jgi:hypothetical protein